MYHRATWATQSMYQRFCATTRTTHPDEANDPIPVPADGANDPPGFLYGSVDKQVYK